MKEFYSCEICGEITNQDDEVCGCERKKLSEALKSIKEGKTKSFKEISVILRNKKEASE